LGCGVGKSLLQAAEAQAKQRADGVLWLAVNAQNARAIAFYARHGYAKVGTSHFCLGKSRYKNHVLVGTDA
jgi:diamine N-acetyltransferase